MSLKWGPHLPCRESIENPNITNVVEYFMPNGGVPLGDVSGPQRNLLGNEHASGWDWDWDNYFSQFPSLDITSDMTADMNGIMSYLMGLISLISSSIMTYGSLTSADWIRNVFYQYRNAQETSQSGNANGPSTSQSGNAGDNVYANGFPRVAIISIRQIQPRLLVGKRVTRLGVQL